MERTEPALVPQWLKCTGSVAGGGTSIHHSDVSSPSRHTSRSFKSYNDKDSLRYLAGFNSRRDSFSNGSAKHPYSSFSRNHRDKNREKEKSLFDDVLGLGSADPLTSISTSRVERSDLRPSHSLGARKPVQKLPPKVDDFKIVGNGALYGGSNISETQRAVFEKDFPSLRSDDKQTVTGIKRVLSPGLTSSVQSLPVGNSGFLSGEKWTSALAEVPNVFANNGNACSPVQQSISTFPNSTSGVSSTMAAALSQPAPRVHALQLPDKNREELAKKHLRLIPVTPMSRTLVASSVDKSKQLKVGVRTNEISMAAKVHPQPHSVLLGNQSRFVQVKLDSPSASHVGKFLVLKTGRESVSVGVKDASGSTCEADGKVANCQHASQTASKTLSTCVISALENKAAALSVNSKSAVDRRSSQSLSQSRSEFFNLMRRKTSSRASNIRSDLNLSDSSASKGGGDAALLMENGNQVIHNGDSYNIPEKIESSDDVGDGDDNFCANGSIYPDEEEAAFLRSLGWEENGGEEEGLTEEEINAFYREYMNSRRPLEMHGSSELKFSIPAVLPNSIE